MTTTGSEKIHAQVRDVITHACALADMPDIGLDFLTPDDLAEVSDIHRLHRRREVLVDYRTDVLVLLDRLAIRVSCSGSDGQDLRDLLAGVHDHVDRAVDFLTIRLEAACAERLGSSFVL